MPAVPEGQADKFHVSRRRKVFVGQLVYGKERREIGPRLIELRAQIGRRYLYDETIRHRI